MQANHIRDIRRDSEYTREGCEHSPAYWEIILLYRRKTELERQMEIGLLQEQRKELRRRCLDNDKPGKRHMLPFVWDRRVGFDGTAVDIQCPLKFGSPRYEREIAKIEAKIKAVRHGR